MAAAGTGRWQAVILAVLRERGWCFVEDVVDATGACITRSALVAVRRAACALADQEVIVMARARTGRPTTRTIVWLHYPDPATSRRRQQTPRALSCYGESVDSITAERTTDRVTPSFISPVEFGRVIAKTPDCVRRLLREGKIEGVHVGGTWRIPVSALDRLEAAARQRLR